MKINHDMLSEYIEQHAGVRPGDLAIHFGVSERTIYRHLDTLLSQGRVMKRGKVPNVRYYPFERTKELVHFDADIVRTLEAEWYQISKRGESLTGVQGFVQWCEKRGQEPVAAAKRWRGHIAYIDSITTPYGIDAMKKLHDYGHDILSNLWYGSIYALPEFGKTKMGTLMEIAKTNPSVTIFDELISSILPHYLAILNDFAIDSLCFVQPTAQRKLQIMSHLEKVLRKKLPVLPLYKVPGYFPPQKSLKKREDRISNAEASFDLEAGSYTSYKHTLLIDDAVGSGATLVEVGRKLLHEKRTQKVSAFSLTGTANGIFDAVHQFEVLAAV